jgi:hypothetical protein
MKIAFDFNGVLDTYPALWELVAILRASGHTVGLVTGNSSGVFPPEIKERFDFCIFCDGPEEEMRLSGKVASSHEEKMRWWKSAALKEAGVSLIFEDYAREIQGTTAVQIGKPV